MIYVWPSKILNPNFSIQEANYNIFSSLKFPGYKIEYNKLTQNNDTARTILLVDNNISYKRRYDVENDFISSIWIQVNITKNTYLLLCSYYHQWQLPTNIRDT